MTKFDAGRASVLALTAVAVLASFLLGKSLTKVSAGTQEDWSCKSNGPQCGANLGTQYVCPESYVRYENTCRKWVSTVVYNCNFVIDIHGTNYNVSEFYNKPTGDDHHCHRINWNGGDSLGDTKQDHFEAMHHFNHDYGSPDHGNWLSAYNDHITQNPDALVDTGSGEWSYTPKVSQSCTAGDPKYDSCTPAGQCPTECGQEASRVSDGKGGFISCEATQACENGETPAPVPTPETCVGDQHLDATGLKCVSFSQSGPPPAPPYTPPTGGQVLGASTMAGTGTFAENLYIAIMGLGGIITALGVKNFKKGYKVA